MVIQPLFILCFVATFRCEVLIFCYFFRATTAASGDDKKALFYSFSNTEDKFADFFGIFSLLNVEKNYERVAIHYR